MTLKERTQYVQIFPEELDALRVATSTIEPFPPLAFKRLQRLLQRAENLNFGNPAEPYRPGFKMMSYEKRLELARAQHNADKAEARERREASAVHHDDDDVEPPAEPEPKLAKVPKNSVFDKVVDKALDGMADDIDEAVDEVIAAVLGTEDIPVTEDDGEILANKQLAETQAIATHLSVISDALGENTNAVKNASSLNIAAVAQTAEMHIIANTRLDDIRTLLDRMRTALEEGLAGQHDTNKLLDNILDAIVATGNKL